jgi:hypothetical protein
MLVVNGRHVGPDNRDRVEGSFHGGACEYLWLRAVATPMHFHGKDAIAVYLKNGRLKATAPDGDSVVSEYLPGFTKFNQRNRIHSEQLVTGEDERAIVVDLK